MNQPFLTFRDGEIKWIRSAELAIDDYVAKPLSLPTFDKIIEIKLPEYEHLQLVKEDDNFCYAKIKTAGEDTIVRLPKKLDEQLAEFLGLFVSEGSISKNGVTICNSDPKLRERITQLFEELFVPDSRIKRSKKGITVYSTPLVKYLERVLGMPLGQKKSHSIKLPMELAKGTVEVIAGFLRGAYNGDGHRCETMITYGTMSKQLAQGITYLLTLLGIKSKFWQNKKGLFLITISGKKEIQAFNRIVYGEEIGEEVRRYYNARYTLPDVSNLLYQTKKELGIRYGREIPEGLTEAVISGRKSCGRIRLQRIMKSFEPYLTDAFRESSIYQTLKFIADSDVSWIRVTDIDKAEPQEMYDLETEVGSFVGGNLPLILHNSKWVGDSEAGIREVFKKARQAAPCILFLDELDAMAPSRSGGASDSHVSERVVSQLLTEMDGIEDMRGVVVLAATNRLDIIDAALLRPGRFDLLLELPVPDETARRAIFGVHTKNKPIADDIDLDRLVKETDGRVGSDIELICRRAAMLAIREFLQNKDNLGNGKPDYSSIKIRMEHFVKAMEILKRET
jgi:transitional endoplasmic reticulum ATPase